jgi:hypothetical protein
MDQPETTPVLSEQALQWADRGLWAVCIGVYLIIFVGGLLARGDDLQVMGRAVGFTLLTAVLGKICLALAARASQPVEPTEEGQLDEPDGPIGSLDDEALSTNVAEQEEDWANAA